MLSDNTFALNLNAICRAGGFNFVPEGTECRSYQHSFYVLHKFYYFKSGNCKITIQDKEYEGIPNRWFFIPAMVPHSYGNYDLQHYADYWLHFDLQPDGIQAFDEYLPYYVDVPNNSRVDKIFKSLLRAEKSNKAADVFKAKAALMELIGEYIRLALPDLCVSESKDPDIQRITEYITANIDKNITVEELAHLCHLHPTHFIRAFKNKAGETPGKFVQLHKLAYAKRLLEESKIPINEVMGQVGITDAAQFAKKFRILYGFSPREYRKHMHIKAAGIQKKN